MTHPRDAALEAGVHLDARRHPDLSHIDAAHVQVAAQVQPDRVALRLTCGTTQTAVSVCLSVAEGPERQGLFTRVRF